MSNLDKVIQFYYIPSVWNIEKTSGFEIKRMKWDDGSECQLSSKWIKQLITWHLLFEPTHFSSRQKYWDTWHVYSYFTSAKFCNQDYPPTKWQKCQSLQKDLLMIPNIRANCLMAYVNKESNKQKTWWRLLGFKWKHNQSLQKNCSRFSKLISI